MAVNRVALDEFDPAVDAIEPSDQTRFNLFEYSVTLESQPVDLLATDVPVSVALDEFDPSNNGFAPWDLNRLNVLEYSIPAARPCLNLDTYLVDTGPTPSAPVLKDVLEDILDALVEPRTALDTEIVILPPTFPSGIERLGPGVRTTVVKGIDSGLWTIDEIVRYLSERQAEFLSRTGVVYRRASIFFVPQTQRHPVPEDWSLTRRLALRSRDGRVRNLHRVDAYELDHADPDWQTATETPRVFSDQATTAPDGFLETSPASRADGLLELLYVPTGAAFTPLEGMPLDGALGQKFSVPPDFIPALRWGALSMALGKIGRGLDPERAAHAEERYREGIAVALFLLAGWST